MIIFLLLWSFLTIAFALQSNCPYLCECDQNDSSWNVYCRKAIINDTVYAEILNQLPLTLRSLHIQVRLELYKDSNLCRNNGRKHQHLIPPHLHIKMFRFILATNKSSGFE